MARLAERNAVAGRIEVRGCCHAADLAPLVDAAVRPALIVDVEGYETELLQPVAAPGLLRSAMIVELHDCFQPGIEAALVERFRSTHTIERLPAVARTAADLPPALRLPGRLACKATAEGRPDGMAWLLLWPGGASGRQPQPARTYLGAS
jgi:hypothetical protein